MVSMLTDEARRLLNEEHGADGLATWVKSAKDVMRALVQLLHMIQKTSKRQARYILWLRAKVTALGGDPEAMTVVEGAE
jgi:hypothetical protein